VAHEYRKLLADLSRSAWKSLKVFIQDAVSENDPIPGAVIAVQTFGDFLGFNPHCHILVTDGCFYGDGGREPVERCPHECAAGDLQLQAHADTIYGDPEYSWDAYIHA
jgi:Putative transposase